MHLQKFYNIIKQNRLVVFVSKMKLFQTKIKILGHKIIEIKISPISEFRIYIQNSQ